MVAVLLQSLKCSLVWRRGKKKKVTQISIRLIVQFTLHLAIMARIIRQNCVTVKSNVMNVIKKIGPDIHIFYSPHLIRLKAQKFICFIYSSGCVQGACVCVCVYLDQHNLAIKLRKKKVCRQASHSHQNWISIIVLKPFYFNALIIFASNHVSRLAATDHESKLL